MADVTGLVRRERAQAERRHQPFLDCVDHFARALDPATRDQRQSADGEDLVRAKGAIDGPGLMIAVDHVVKITALLIPETRSESGSRFFEDRLASARKISRRSRGH